MTIIHQDSPDGYSVAETVKTYPGAKTSALDFETHNLFLSCKVSGSFTVLVVGR